MRTASKERPQAPRPRVSQIWNGFAAYGYILIPLTDEGAVNVGPLIGYASELSQPRRGQQVLDQLKESGITDETVLEPLVIAAEDADAMQENQLHAISLMRSVYILPDMPQLEAIPDFPLTEEELAMSDDQREAIARGLILDVAYSKRKSTISQNITQCVEMLRGIARETAGIVSRRIPSIAGQDDTVTAL